jgi:hypothetical protein
MNTNYPSNLPRLVITIFCVAATSTSLAGVLNKQEQLDRQTFWDNRDWDWYKSNIPFFECPDPDITTTYYYRWELTTKHVTYGSPQSGYSYTEFMDRPFWSGAYGAISCPAGHQFYDLRWLHDPRYAQDYSRYWLRTPGAQPRNYSTWLADSVWAVHLVHRDEAFTKDLLPDLIENHARWEKRHFVPEQGMFWQIGHDDGMEYNIASRQTANIFRGAPSFRPSFNSYMWADAQAIARIAELAGDSKMATEFRAKAVALKTTLQSRLWDARRDFFLIRFRDNEANEKDFPGKPIKAGTLIYEDGPFAGSPEGRELIGYVPWQFNLPDAGYESAWRFLMDSNYFFAPFGPSFVGRNDPLFKISKSCCWWSGQSWPFATTQTLKALANLLQNYSQTVISRADYLTMLRIFSLTHRKNGEPYIAEAAHPDTGSWEGHDGYNHSEHYFHSGFTDLIITGLAGVKPRADDVFEIDPLAPADWPWFALDDLPYRGHRVSVVWDKSGARYGQGAGLHVLLDGKKLASTNQLTKLTVKLPPSPMQPAKKATAVNYVVNNDGDYFPQLMASFTSERTSLTKLNDGNYWYHLHPPNRWTMEGTSNATDSLEVDFGVKRLITNVKLYFLDDGETVVPPESFTLENWTGSGWQPISQQVRNPERPTGRRPNVVSFPETPVQKLRAVFTHGKKGHTGLTELEAWGELAGQFEIAPPPAGNLALNLRGEGYPKASASAHDRFGGIARLANDGRTVYRPNPVNRWTAYGSTNDTDWLEVDFGPAQEIGRVELCIYDDRGGVQAPADYFVEYWTGKEWQAVANQKKSPAQPVGSAVNTVTFPRISTAKFRVVFLHKGKARSGVTEILAWRE